MVAVLQLFFINVSIINAVDIIIAQVFIIDEWAALVMLEPQRLEEIHINYRRSGRNDRIDHVVFHKVGVKLHAAACGCRARQRQEDRAFFISEHHIVNFCGLGQVARGERHIGHLVDDRARVERGDVDMLHLLGKHLLF
jgi:hypothetical protein